MKIGVASSDGIVVNAHFGKSEKFYIYEVADAGDIELLEVRKASPVCIGGDHDDAELEKAAERLGDLDLVIVSRIGPGARNALYAAGIECYELPTYIEEAIRKAIAYRQVQAMISEAMI